ncbi:MAG TPA: hypothetical protein EYO58_06040 [Flavobacteriales bacterium]|nr:hypothetical protein [Flavobacteriales bacterium]
MIKVEFIMPDDTRVHVASFKEDDMYLACLDSLEAQAHKENATLDETIIKDTIPALKWDGVDKIIHQGYWYGKYTDLKYTPHGNSY